MAKKYLKVNNGKIEQQEATSVSTGATNAGDVVALDSSGKLDPSVLPVGVGPDVLVVEASEDLIAGDYVNIFDDGGTVKARKADNSNGRDAHGWVKTGVLTGANATVYFEGANENLTGLTAGGRVYLGTSGGVVQTPLDPTLPANTGKLSQFLGIAVATDTVNTDIDDCILL